MMNEFDEHESFVILSIENMVFNICNIYYILIAVSLFLSFSVLLYPFSCHAT